MQTLSKVEPCTPTASRDARIPGNDPAFERHTLSRIAHWNTVARPGDKSRNWSAAYHKRIRRVYQLIVPPGQRVLEVGSGHGDLLAALEPSVGVGIDFSPGMIEEARRRHPTLTFLEADAHSFALEETFDVVILSDLVNDLWDVQRALERVRGVCGPRTRVVLNAYSRLWGPPLTIARKLGLAKPLLEQNWLTVGDIHNLLELAGFQMIRTFAEVIWPLGTPLVSPVLNRVAAKVWPTKYLAMTNFIVARPAPDGHRKAGEPSVSVIVPARNEAGNISSLLDQIPTMGAGTDVVFVEGNSTDDTYAVLEESLKRFTRLPCVLLKQTGKGKGDAVRLGFERARGDIVMILDADLTVPPVDLPRFYEALRSGLGEFVNGVRLVYPMEDRAMRFLNLAGNKFFGFAFSWILGQGLRDTLCGTKALWREDYQRIAANRAFFGEFDPFGDFDLIFGSARLNLRIVDVPVRYRERTYGQTNIDRWRHGWLLLRMAAFAARRLKFV